MEFKVWYFLFVLYSPTAVQLFALHEDQVKDLPGLSPQPEFRHYSGYLQAAPTHYFHYWFVESQKEPINDPLVVWFNGGPGCSSMAGLLAENGPFQVQNEGKFLKLNQFSWNTIANVVYIESPAGVGYSYSSDGEISTDDNKVTEDNYNAILSFIKKFPEYSKNPLFITGESYGGFYIPLLMTKLIENPLINIQGFAIGNPLLSRLLNFNSRLLFYYTHGMIGETLWSEMVAACCNGSVNKCNFDRPKIAKCFSLVKHAFSVANNPTIDPYDMYDNCGRNQLSRFHPVYQKYMVDILHYAAPMYFGPIVNYLNKENDDLLSQLRIDKVIGTLACDLANNTMAYLNRDDVRLALHIKPGLPQWQPCNANVTDHYKQLYSDMFDIFHIILKKSKTRFLIYVGDFDTTCNFIGCEWFIAQLKLPEVSMQRPWFYNAINKVNLTGGWVHEYSRGAITTIWGAGHLSPTYKPKATLDMLQRFLTNTSL